MTESRSGSILRRFLTPFALLFLAALFVLLGADRIQAAAPDNVAGIEDTSVPGGNEGHTSADSMGVSWTYKIIHANVGAADAGHIGCKAMITSVYYAGGGAITFSVPNTIQHNGFTYPVYKIADSVFKNNVYVSMVEVGTNMQEYGDDCFAGCVNLTGNAPIPLNTMTKIGARCFDGCTAITDATIGPNVTHIGDGAFSNCRALALVGVSAGNSSFKSVDSVLYSADGIRLICYPAGKSMGSSILSEFVVPDTVKTIGAQAFEGCNNLYHIKLSNDLTTIGDKAFYGCGNLVDITIPSTVTYIGSSAFTGCPSGFIIYCSKSLSGAAEQYARVNGINAVVTCTVRFFDGTNLLDTQQVIYGNSATPPVVPEKLGYTLRWNKAYDKIVDNVDIYTDWKVNYTVTFKDSVTGNQTVFTAYHGEAVTAPVWVREGYILSWDKTDYGYVTKNLIINAVWIIDWTKQGPIEDDKPNVGASFSDSKLYYQVTAFDASGICTASCVGAKKTTYTSLVIPSTVNYKGYVFQVTKIGTSAFSSMKQLKKVTIGSNIKTISKKAFYKCTALKTIYINSTKLTSVGTYAFKSTYSKPTVYAPSAKKKSYKTKLRDASISSKAVYKSL